MTAISKAQIQKMHALARKAGVNEDDLHAMVFGMYNKVSIRELTSYEGIKVIDRLMKLNGEEPKQQSTPAGRATTAQQGKIYALARELGWGDDPKRLRGFLKARFHVEDVRWLPEGKSGAVIEALKAMRDGCRGERKRGAK